MISVTWYKIFLTDTFFFNQAAVSYEDFYNEKKKLHKVRK